MATLLHGVVGAQVRSVDTTRRLFSVDSHAQFDDAALDRATLAAAAELLGCGERLLADSVEYVKQRKQYGRTIGSYQAIKHQLADVRIALDFAPPLVLGAALTGASRDVSAAKVAAGDAAYLSSRVALQVHGAIGYTAEFDLGLWINRVRALVGAWGTASYHRGRIAQSLANECSLMHFARTEEQDELAAIVRSLLGKRSDSAAVRAATGSEAGYDQGLWQALCEQVGVAALPIPEEYDGFGASLVETAVVLEEIGANLAPSPLLATSIATAAVVLHADEETERDLLPRIAAGETATVVLDELVLDPESSIVLLPTTEGLSVLDGAGLVPRECLDQTIRLGTHDIHDPGDGGETQPLRDIAAALTTALQVGAAQRGLDMTVAYSKERVQFGRPIGSFQALKHRMADMLVLVESSRSASWGATASAASYVTDPTDDNAGLLHRRAAVARSYCSDALDHVASETVQLHGGIAITWEHDAQLVFKRAHLLNRLWGPAHSARADVGSFPAR